MLDFMWMQLYKWYALQKYLSKAFCITSKNYLPQKTDEVKNNFIALAKSFTTSNK